MEVTVIFSKENGKTFPKTFSAPCTRELVGIRNIKTKEVERLPISTVDQLLLLSEEELKALKPARTIVNFYHTLKKRLFVSAKRMDLKLSDALITKWKIVQKIASALIEKILAPFIRQKYPARTVPVRQTRKRISKDKQTKNNKLHNIRKNPARRAA